MEKNQTTEREVSLVEANAYADKVARSLAEERDACIAEMLEPFIAVYGPDKAATIRVFLANVIDGKPVTKPKPLRRVAA